MKQVAVKRTISEAKQFPALQRAIAESGEYQAAKAVKLGILDAKQLKTEPIKYWTHKGYGLSIECYVNISKKSLHEVFNADLVTWRVTDDNGVVVLTDIRYKENIQGCEYV